jgi:hypothetical protein
MATTQTAPRIRNVRGQTDPDTHKALRVRQLAMEKKNEVRPDLTEVVTAVLKEWAQQQPE